MNSKRIHPDAFMVPFVEKLMADGASCDHVHFDFSNESASDYKWLLSKFSEYSNDNVETAIKEALSLQYLKHATLGGRHLKVEIIGFHMGLRYQEQAKQLASRSILKRTSDWVDEHKGISVLYSAIVGTLGLVLSLFNFLTKH